jgi:hypothetical protein
LKINYSPHVSQRLIHDALADVCSGLVIMVIAGRRFGKTVLACNEIIKRALLIPNARIWYIAPTKDQAFRIAWKVMLKYLPPELVAKKREDRHTIELVNGSLIEFMGVQDQIFLLGVGLHFVVLDEFPTIPWSVWEDTIKPMLMDYNGDALMIGSVPDPKTHSITKEFLELYEDGLASAHIGGAFLRSFNFPSSDNPYTSKVKRDRDIADLRRRGREGDVKRIYEGGYTREYGLVFPDFKIDVHTCDPFEIPPTWIRIMAIDPHPQKPIHGLWMAQDPNKEWWFYMERCFEMGDSRHPLTVQESAAQMRLLEGESKVRLRLIDPTFAKMEQKVIGQKSVFQQYADLGLYFREGNRDFMTFFNEITDRFRALPHTTVHIFKTCPGLIRQLQSYMWDSWSSLKAREEKGAKDRPKATNDDFISCMKYIANTNVPNVDPDKVRDQLAGLNNSRWQRLRAATA